MPDPTGISKGLHGWEIERLLELAKHDKPWLTENVAPSRAYEQLLVRHEVIVNEVTGTATLAWRLTDLGRQVAEVLSRV